MELLNDIMHVFVCIFEIYIVFDFFRAFFCMRDYFDTALKRAAVILTFAFMVWGVNSFDNTIINFVGVPIVYFIMCSVFFIGDFLKKILCTAIAELTIFGTEFGFAVLLSITSEDILKSSMVNDSSMMIVMIIMKFITFIIFVIFKQFAMGTTAKMDRKVFRCYMTIPLSSLGLMASVMYSGIDFEVMSYSKILLMVFFVLLFVGNILTFYGFNRHSELISQKNLDEKVMLTQKMQLESYERSEEANNKYSELIHNMNHNVRTILDLLCNEQLSEAKDLLEDLENGFESVKLFEYCRIPIVNAILSDYADKAKSHAIEYNVFIEPCFNIEYVNKMDIVSMLSNLLANAIEAAQKCNHGKIDIKMFMQNDGDFSIVKIENTYTGKILSDKDRIMTTKKDKANHGLGIMSVNNTAEKYNGYLHSSWKNNVFKSVLILQNSRL